MWHASCTSISGKVGVTKTAFDYKVRGDPVKDSIADAKIGMELVE